MRAVERSLPADVAVFAAAVADWRTAVSPRDKIKKTGEKRALDLVENPDILATIGKSSDRRPALVIGFAAETRDIAAYASKKRKAKGADWIVANDVSPETGVIGGDEQHRAPRHRRRHRGLADAAEGGGGASGSCCAQPSSSGARRLQPNDTALREKPRRRARRAADAWR